MQVVFCGLCSLAVASIFYTWREYQARLAGREKQLRERVTYMLWVTANAAAD